MMSKKTKTHRPTSLIVAPIPPKLTYYDSRQRVKKNEDNATLRLFMPIQPFDDRFEEAREVTCHMDIEKEVQVHINANHEAFESPYAWRRHFKGFDAKRAQEIRYEMSIEEIIARRSLNVADFSTMESPYVPRIILVLVNAIETHCFRANFWAWMLCEWSDFHKEAVDLLGHLLFVHRHELFLQNVLERLSPALLIRTLRVFLSAFSPKFLHFFKRDIQEIIKRPLYDQFIRPNPNIRLIVQHALLPYSRTIIDTAAFLMLHIQHFLLMYPTSGTERSLLTKIYGPLLIGFSERPVAINKTATFVSEEASLLEAILEVCNAGFWNHLGMLKINSAFDNLQRFVVKLPNLKYSSSTVRKIYREEFEVRDYVSEHYLLQGEKYYGLTKKRKSHVARQTFVFDHGENERKSKEDAIKFRCREFTFENRTPQKSTKLETSKSKVKVSSRRKERQLIAIRSNDAIFRDIQTMR
ncbi:unnamed protein product, partial [Hydatigera taeniaeformis]|uniref:Uncharacterized protein n=1 Tax=Hydatigena taeniaeformis TaxID=6205 RepID=A0A0R3X672_HYDTA